MYGKLGIIAEIKSKRLEWLGHVVGMKENRMVEKFLKGERLVGLGSDGWTILRRILD
jgi:hypothetical protein